MQLTIENMVRLTGESTVVQLTGMLRLCHRVRTVHIQRKVGFTTQVPCSSGRVVSIAQVDVSSGPYL